MIESPARRAPGSDVAKDYDFHGIFALRLRADRRGAVRHFQAEYGAFEVRGARPVDLDVTVGAFSPRPDGAVRLFRDYHRSADWIYGAGQHKVARWRFALSGLLAPTTRLLFDGGIFSLDFLQHFLVEQIMRHKICRHGFALVHGGCVASGGSSVLFPGLGHTGKTALALRQALLGREFQSDDFTFISASGQTYSYPRRLHVSDHLYAVCPEAMRPLGLRRRLSIEAKKRIRQLTLNYGALEEAVQLSEVAPRARIADVARLRAVLLLTGSTVAEPEGPRPLERPDAINRVVAMNRLEGRAFDDVMLGYQYADPTVDLAESWQREREVLERALDDVPVYEMLVPRQPRDHRAVLDRVGGALSDLLE